MLKLRDFLRIADAAEYLGVCPNTLRNWGRAGKITEYRHPANNYRLYRQGDLDAMLDATVATDHSDQDATRSGKIPR